jgi:hypothetical protein
MTTLNRLKESTSNKNSAISLIATLYSNTSKHTCILLRLQNFTSTPANLNAKINHGNREEDTRKDKFKEKTDMTKKTRV